MRIAPSARWLVTIPAIWVALVGVSARADGNLDFLISQLKTSDDFRVRTQAALGLGATGDSAAVQPLCGALDDSSEAVRGASAAALGKLGKPEGIPCLQAKRGSEQNGSVKSQIEKAIKALSGGGSGGALPANARVYVALGKTNNKTARDADEVDAQAVSIMSAKLGTMDGYALAPRGEAPSAAKKIIADKKLNAFQLTATIEKPVYDGDRLTVSVRVIMMGYPGKDIKGEFAPKLTQSGTSQGDRASEDLLIKMALERALDSFDKVVASM